MDQKKVHINWFIIHASFAKFIFLGVQHASKHAGESIAPLLATSTPRGSEQITTPPPKTVDPPAITPEPVTAPCQ